MIVAMFLMKNIQLFNYFLYNFWCL